MKTYFILITLFSAGFVGVRYVFVEQVKRYFGLGMYVSFTAVTAFGFLLHNAGQFILLSAICFLLTVKNRMDALCRLIVLVALTPAVTYPLNMNGLYLSDLTTPIALSTSALLVCLLRPRFRSIRLITAEDILVVVLMTIFSVASARASSFTGISREVVTISLGLGLPFFVFSRFIANRTEFAQIVGALAGAALILATIAMYEAKFHWSVYDTIWYNQSSSFFMSHNINIRAGLLRTPTAFREATSYAVFQLVGTFAVIASRGLFRTKILWIGSVVLSLTGLMAAQSRGADIALLVGLIALMMVRRQFARAVGVTAASIILIVTLVAGASSFPKLAALLGADRTYGSDADYRQTLLRRGIEEGLKHPLLGDDMTRVAERMRDMVQGEGIVDFVNSFLVIFLSSGLAGLIIVLILLSLIMKNAFTSTSQGVYKKTVHGVETFLFPAIVAVIVALLFTSFWERNPYWLVVILAGCRVANLPPRRASSNTLGLQ